jgi:hypothetical protein
VPHDPDLRIQFGKGEIAGPERLDQIGHIRR